MPTLNFARLDLDLINPDFLAKVLDAIAACEARGHRYIATSGYRTYGEQDALYAKGRTVPGAWATNAKGGQSSHNFGIAIDFVYDKDIAKPGVQPGWELKDYAVLIEEVEKRGLHSGKNYKDHPHVSLPYITAVDMAPLHARWLATTGDTLTRLKEVWKILDAKKGQR
jgi:peptidoglycan L-alanyl-D-glutamate endopeptidase CwlK